MVAWKDIWFIGDRFINEIYHTLQWLEREAKINKKEAPYVYEFYNITCLSVDETSSGIKSIMTRLVNAYIHGLNTTTQLPRFVLIIPDADILKYIGNFEFGVSIMSGSAINWIANQIDRATECRKDDLIRCKPGAVCANEPKFVWVKMFNRTNGSGKDEMLKVRSKYNNALEEMLINKKGHFIIDITDKMSDTAYYTVRNELNSDGRIRFWKEVDNKIKDFDHHKISLKPIPVPEKSIDKDAMQRRRKMPTPPPNNRAQRFQSFPDEPYEDFDSY